MLLAGDPPAIAVIACLGFGSAAGSAVAGRLVSSNMRACMRAHTYVCLVALVAV